MTAYIDREASQEGRKRIKPEYSPIEDNTEITENGIVKTKPNPPAFLVNDKAYAQNPELFWYKKYLDEKFKLFSSDFWFGLLFGMLLFGFLACVLAGSKCHLAQ